MKSRVLLSWLGVLSGALLTIAQSNVTLTIQADKPGAVISPTMWGIFFEDINFGADGGLYAELVKNRSFEFPDPLMGWTKLNPSGAADSVTVLDKSPVDSADPHYLHLQAQDENWSGVANEGFRGIGVRAGAKYRFSAFARSLDRGPTVLRIALVGSDGKLLA